MSVQTNESESPSLITWEQAVQSLRSDPAMTELSRWCYYDDPIVEAFNRFCASPEWQSVLQIASRQPCRDVLEIGAGRGVSACAFAKAGYKTTALEPDKSKIVGTGAIRQLLQDTQLNVTIEENWGESLPFDDASFDLVYCRAVFHHVRDREKFCQEVARVLRPAGRLLATREHVISSEEQLQKFLANHPLHHLYGGEAAYELHEYVSAIRSSALEVTDIIGPHSSAINYFPHDASAHRSFMEFLVGLKLGRFGPRLVRCLPLPEPFLVWAANRVDETPGRLYSFVARKA